MKPAPFDYARPATVEEAVRLLADAGGGATVIAGGQTLMPLLALRMSQPFILVDVSGIPALRGTSEVAGATRIGPMTRQNDVLTDPLLARRLPMLVEAVRHVGHHQTRNRDTIGGSICFGEPAAESPACAVALGATLTIASVRGERQVAAREFYLGPYMTVLEPDELVTAIDFPDWPAGTVTLFHELARRPGDFALVGLVGALAVERGRVVRAGIAWFGMGPTPVAAVGAEAALVGRAVADLDADAIAEAALADCEPFDDHHCSADYRRSVGRRLFGRAIGDALDLRRAA